HDGTTNSIWANHYTPSSGWGNASMIETGRGLAYAPQLAMNTSGNAVAVWVQKDGMAYSIWANRYTAGSGWGNASMIETGAGSAAVPQVVMDANGNAVAVWEQHNGTTSTIYSIWANHSWLDLAGRNLPPFARAGTDQTVAEESQVTLDGSASWDADGTVASYSWTQTAGPAVGLTGENTVSPTFMAPLVNADITLTFVLTATDNVGAVARDNVHVRVHVDVAPTAPQPPKVIHLPLPGPRRDTLPGQLPEPADAPASATTPSAVAPRLAPFSPIPKNDFAALGDDNSAIPPDTHGTIASYAWAQRARTSVRIKAPPKTILTFTLTVTDNNGAVARDNVTRTVSDVQ
ncbi:MAG: hypothetical protein IH808_10290, partial [Proteobacteria bacterium]|nr:hypothetical protein [Pseudomonadota bacterium]